MVTMDNRYLEAEGTAISDIAGAIPVSGQMDSHSTVRAERGVDRSVEIIDETAPLHYVRQDLPPMLILAGSDDLPGRSDINRRFQQAIQQAGHKDSRFIEVAGRDHTSIVFKMDDPADEVVRIMLDFINRL
jgi:alpha-beta hydrolase superfamily lysophospholipase